MKKLIVAIIILIVLGVAWYGLSPLLRNKHIEDTLPAAVPQMVETEEQTAATKTETQISEPVSIVDTKIHPASGQVRVIKEGEKATIRYENFQTINGPDVRVYLANDLEAKDFIELGPIKGTSGNINYEVPTGVNVDNYRYVLHWCEDFSVLFNSADLSQIRK